MKRVQNQRSMSWCEKFVQNPVNHLFLLLARRWTNCRVDLVGTIRCNGKQAAWLSMPIIQPVGRNNDSFVREREGSKVDFDFILLYPYILHNIFAQSVHFLLAFTGLTIN